jgi:transcriptional regulator GlxA family with amidase domain
VCRLLASGVYDNISTLFGHMGIERGGKMKCTLLLLDNSPVTSVTGPMEIFSLANSLVPKNQRMQLQLVSPSGNDVACLGGLSLSVHGQPDYEKADDPGNEQTTDLVIVGAIGHPDHRPAEYDSNILDWIRKQYYQGSRVASICTGSFVLAATGLLDGMAATTHWQCASLFRQRFPQVKLKEQVMITEQERLFCSAGASAYQDMSIYLVRVLWGEVIADQCAKALLIDLDRHGQSQYASFQPYRQHNDELILGLQGWLDDHYKQDLTMVELAERVHLSERQFKRRFKQATQVSPLAYVQSLRMELAKKLLATTNKPISEVSHLSGYEDLRFFRQLFKRFTALSPSEYRQKFALRA